MTSRRKLKTGIFSGIILFIVTLLTSLTFSQDAVDVTVFVDRDALTIYVPEQGNVSLQNFGFYVQINGQDEYSYLSDYGAFGLPFASIPTPVCFNLLRNGANAALPQNCNPTYTITQRLNAGDVFWLDGVSSNFRTLLMVQGRENISICAAGNTRCEMVYTPPDAIDISLSSWMVSSRTNNDWIPVEQDFDGIPMMLVPPGCFMMGSDRSDSDEQPVHEVCFDDAFWIDKTEVTNEQYGSVSDGTLCMEYSSHPDQPRNCVNWFDAQDFCEARGGRLPTEAEWEYVARGTDSLVYPWGNTWLSDSATYSGNSSGITSVAVSRPDGASWVGALHMSGNAWEWTGSLYKSYPYNKNDGRETEDNTDDAHVMRGGSFFSTSDSLRAASRFSYLPADSFNSNGFRCMQDVE
ncbi:MAG: formylglycine-generating enzyme family protein [Aggregatilineales bacterium]